MSTIPQLDTSNGIDFHFMFYECKSLTTIPQLDTSNGTNFNFMFDGCISLSTISQLDTSNGIDFNSMFYNCSSLTNIPALDLNRGENFSSMFYGCSSLVNIGVTGSINYDISFYNCTKLSYASIKSILTACSNTINTHVKTIIFKRTIQDRNNELTNLVASCTSKGWQVTGLTITTA